MLVHVTWMKKIMPHKGITIHIYNKEMDVSITCILHPELYLHFFVETLKDLILNVFGSFALSNPTYPHINLISP